LQDTKNLALALAGLPKGSILLLTGPMGAGKTTLTQYILQALGFMGEVTSPTYTLIHEYPSPAGLVVHIDAYRMQDQSMLYQLGLEDYIAEARLVIIEWGQGALLGGLEVRLSLEEDTRTFEIIDHQNLQKG
jgi:tRNA threonylcarbamoyladenosine biosynthesis protein TsaE